MTPAEWALASALIAVGAAVQGSIGFGMALVAAPLLVLVDPRLVPGPLLLASLPLVLMMGWRERAALELERLAWPIAGQLAGTAVAFAVLRVASQSALSATIGLVILAGVGLSLVAGHWRPSHRNLVAAGTLAGFMGTTSSIPGPPLALVHQHVAGERLRAALVPFFLVGAVLSLGALALAGRFGRMEMWAGAALLPGVLAGFAASGWLAARLRAQWLRAGVLGLSAASALALIHRALASAP